MEAKRSSCVKIPLKSSNLAKIQATLNKNVQSTPVENESKKAVKRRREEVENRATNLFSEEKKGQGALRRKQKR